MPLQGAQATRGEASCVRDCVLLLTLLRGVAAQIAFYCCKEHQLQDRKRHKAACKAALAAQEAGGSQ